MNGTISYASQEPWLFPSTIKQNILFGEQYESKRYKETLRVCALEYDLSRLEHGDETLVADRGQNLSKGQQARINLARAIYRQSDIFLLDDSLTSLDETVQDFIFKESILKQLKDKFVIMVSQNARHIAMADTVIVLRKGTIDSVRHQENIKKELPLKRDKISPQDAQEVTESKKHISNGAVTAKEDNHRKAYEETKKQGKVELFVYNKYFQFGGGFLLFSFIMCLYTLAQYFDSYSDKLLTSW